MKNFLHTKSIRWTALSEAIMASVFAEDTTVYGRLSSGYRLDRKIDIQVIATQSTISSGNGSHELEV